MESSPGYDVIAKQLQAYLGQLHVLSHQNSASIFYTQLQACMNELPKLAAPNTQNKTYSPKWYYPQKTLVDFSKHPSQKA